MAGQHEYAFAHALVREVAYGQLPRRERATRHVAAARWLETNVGERADDLAETLAHHYTTALDLARGYGDAELADSLTAPALRHLRRAGVRAERFDLARGAEHFARGLALAADEHERAELLSLHAHGLIGLGRIEEAVAEFAQAEEILRRCGSDLEVAQALFGLSGALSRLNDPGRLAAAEAAQRLLEDVEPSAEHVRLWTRLAVTKMLLEDHEAILFWAERAIELAERLGMPEAARALEWRGWARAALGDRGGVEDMRRAVDASDAQGDDGHNVASFAANLAMAVLQYEGPQVALSDLLEAEEVARSRGAEEVVTFARAVAIIMRVNAGDGDTASHELTELPGSSLESACNVVDLMNLRATKAFSSSARGDSAGADVDWLRAQAEASNQTEAAAISLVACGLVDIAGGDAGRGARLLARCAALPRVHHSADYAAMLPGAVRAALAIGDVTLAERLLGDVESLVPLLAQPRASGLTLLAEARDEHEAAAAGFPDAAAGWHDFGVPYEEGHALLGQCPCLAALGRAPEAAAPLAAARKIFARLGAKPALEETEAALAGLGF